MWELATFVGAKQKNAQIHLKMKCCMHPVKDEKSPVTPFSKTSWAAFVQCAQSWMGLETRDSVIAENAKAALNLDSGNAQVPVNPGFHWKCYMLFTNKAHIARAVKRTEKTPQHSEGLYQMHIFHSNFLWEVWQMFLQVGCLCNTLKSSLKLHGLRLFTHKLPIIKCWWLSAWWAQQAI